MTATAQNDMHLSFLCRKRVSLFIQSIPAEQPLFPHLTIVLIRTVSLFDSHVINTLVTLLSCHVRAVVIAFHFLVSTSNIMSKSLAYIPQTPSSSKLLQTNYTPQHSSPLASMDLTVVPSSPGPPSSPVSEVQSRRRAQYKSRTPSASRAFHSQIKLKPPRTRPSSIIGSSRTYGFDQHDLPPIPFALSPAPRTVNTEEGQKEFLRERFKAKCFARARKVHDRELQRRRSASSDASSDGIDFDMDTIDGEDEEDEDKAALNDEVHFTLSFTLSI